MRFCRIGHRPTPIRGAEKVLYFASYIVIDPGETDIPFKKILSETEYRELCEQYGSKAFRVGMGAEAILELLQMVNLEEEEVRLKEELANTTSQKAARLIKRIEVLEAFKNAGTKPDDSYRNPCNSTRFKTYGSA